MIIKKCDICEKQVKELTGELLTDDASGEVIEICFECNKKISEFVMEMIKEHEKKRTEYIKKLMVEGKNNAKIT